MYKKLKEDPTNKIKAEIDNFLEEAETSNIISTEIKTVLVMEYPRVPVMYLVPKIHKSLKDTNGWAIVSGIDCLSTCGYLCRLISTKKIDLPLCLKDTSDFLLCIHNIDVTEEAWLCTLDVQSLYTNIPLEEECEAVRLKLCENPMLSNRDIAF